MDVVESPQVGNYIQQAVYYSLDNDLLPNAQFLASRWHSHQPDNGDATYLLSLCHLRMRQPKLSYDYSKSQAFQDKHIGCVYIFAKSCLELGKIEDGINSVELSRNVWDNGTNHWSTFFFFFFPTKKSFLLTS